MTFIRLWETVANVFATNQPANEVAAYNCLNQWPIGICANENGGATSKDK